MFRTIISSLSTVARKGLTLQNVTNSVATHIERGLKPVFSANFSSLNQNRIQFKQPTILPLLNNSKNDFLQPKSISQEQIRTVIKFSLKTGKRKTVGAVVARFYRLNCGNWIRTIAGRSKQIWRKSGKRRCKVRQHVFCNATQCRLLDKMVSYYWRKPRYYIKNPYEPYEYRENFYPTSRKPWRPEGCDYE